MGTLTQISKDSSFKMTYEIKRFYSGFVTYQVEANSSQEAYKKTNELAIDIKELHYNLEEWNEADEIISLSENFIENRE